MSNRIGVVGRVLIQTIHKRPKQTYKLNEYDGSKLEATDKITGLTY